MAEGQKYEIQSRKRHGKYVTRATTSDIARAYWLYRSLNTFGNYRKRLLHNGVVVHAQVRDLPWN